MRNLIRRDGETGVGSVRDAWDRLWESFYGESPNLLGRQETFVPAFDVYEDVESLYVEAEVPGMAQKDLTLSIEDGVLTLEGEKRTQREHNDSQIHRVERRFGGFRRAVVLPPTVVTDKAEAEVKDGVLCVRFPKREESKPRKIEIRVK